MRDARREYRQNVRQANRDYRQFVRYDYNRLEPGRRVYYADRYYRTGYRPHALNRNSRIGRGQDKRDHCRRPDGTTGLVIGGAALGSAIDRGQVRCS